jgi:hypothetical protein
VVHRPRLTPEHQAILGAVPERDGILADNPPIDINERDPVPIDPTQEMRQPKCVRPLRIRPAAAARHPREELARLGRPNARPDDREPATRPARHTQVDLNRKLTSHANQPLRRR